MNTAACSVRLPSLRFISQRSLFTSSYVPIKERSLLSRKMHIITCFPATVSSRALRCCSVLLHPNLRRAPSVGTVGLRNPATSSPVREKGDKVFGERSARLLVFSSRIPSRTPTTSSPTTTTSRTSTTSSTTWATTPTPTRTVPLLRSTCSCPLCSR